MASPAEILDRVPSAIRGSPEDSLRGPLQEEGGETKLVETSLVEGNEPVETSVVLPSFIEIL